MILNMLNPIVEIIENCSNANIHIEQNEDFIKGIKQFDYIQSCGFY